MKVSFEGQAALVTGAARGLGFAIAAELGRRGARVVLTDRDAEALEAAVESLRAQGITGTGRVLDVTDSEAIALARREVVEAIGPLSVLVNNAGTVFGGAFLEVPLERHQATLRVNIEGVVAMTHAFLPDLIASPQGRLVNIASASAFLGLPWATTYGSSKWAVAGFSESLRLELAELGHHHVRVTVACPSYVDTELFAGARPPRLTPRLDADRVATAVLNAAQRGRRRVLMPALARTAPLAGALPAVASDFFNRALGVTTSMKRWRGRSDA